MDSFQKLIKRMVCVANNKDWAIWRRDPLAEPIGVKPKPSIIVPLRLVMQQNIGNLQETKCVLYCYNVLTVFKQLLRQLKKRKTIHRTPLTLPAMLLDFFF